jgi:hypothetical protein
MKVSASGTDLHGILPLFAQVEAPEYHVALGSVDREYVASNVWPFRD